MKTAAIKQGFIDNRRMDKRVQTPLIADRANLEQKPAVRIFACCRILFRQVEPALFRSASTFGRKIASNVNAGIPARG
jgi:hypothetical protein